jgi:serine/threonine protein kinase
MKPYDDDACDPEESSSDPGDSKIGKRAPRAPQLTRLGRYRLVREIASGGMASVNLAVTEGLDKLVALKMIHPHLAQEESFVHMFLDEARIASSISHRNVCNTFDFGEAEGRYYIAMDYLAGHTLRDLIIRLRRCPAEAEPRRLAAYMAYLLAEACEGLHAAHELRDTEGKLQEVVHRDVSPHNLFLTYEGNVSVVDFGIARASDRLQHTATGVLKGKFSYMAPEQVRQQSVDRRADIWSLGVCLWESLTLERLFVRSSQADTLMSVMMDRVRPPSEVNPQLPASVDAICARALSRSPGQRYATAREMGRDLMQVVRDSGVVVGPVELEQWLERLFPRERESARQLTRYAKLAALDGSWAGDGTPPPLAHTPTRSGLVPKVKLGVGTGSVSISAVAVELADGDVLQPSANLELLTRPPTARSSLGKGLFAGGAALVGLLAAVGLGWGLRGTSAPTSSPLEVNARAARPATVELAVEPARVAPAPAAAATAPSEPETVLEVLPAQELDVVEPTRAAPRSERRASSARKSSHDADASRSALVEQPSGAPIPGERPAETTEPEQAAPAPEPAPQAPPPSASPAPAPAPTVVTSALRDAPTPAPAPAAPRPVAPKAPERLAARAAVGELEVDGSLGSGVVARMLGRATPLLEECYAEAARRAGRNNFAPLSANLTIDEMGKVRKVETSSHPLSGMAGCAADALKRLRSERTPDVGVVRAKLQITLKP